MQAAVLVQAKTTQWFIIPQYETGFYSSEILTATIILPVVSTVLR